LGKLKKDWFNDDCHFERRNFRKRKRIFQKNRTNENFDDFKLSASGFSFNVLKNSNSLLFGMFGCSLVLPFFNSFQNSCELLDFKLILKCIKKLKNNKACGEDLVIHDYIKSTTNTFIDIYEQLFNIIFETGIVPDNWLMGYIKLIYKNKGDKMDPKNYRPITILSCLGNNRMVTLSRKLHFSRITAFLEKVRSYSVKSILYMIYASSAICCTCSF
jgi:hypothetical protein